MGNSCQLFNSTEDKLLTVMKYSQVFSLNPIILQNKKMSNVSLSNTLPPIVKAKKLLNISCKSDNKALLPQVSMKIQSTIHNLNNLFSTKKTKSEITEIKSSKKECPISSTFKSF